MISKSQARQAFYKAAETIERNPELYDFNYMEVGGEGCPACMWGHVGRELGFGARDSVGLVAAGVGVAEAELYWISDEDCEDPQIVASKYLRPFADKYFPESETEAA